jgi:hypothetical protein
VASIDFDAIARKYGRESNWNALRGSNDPLTAGLDPNANWNSFRPQRTETSPAPAPSTPAPAPPPYQPPAPAPAPAPAPQAPAPAPYGGPGPFKNKYTDKNGKTVYVRQADDSLWTDDPDPNSVYGFVPYNGGAQGGGDSRDKARQYVMQVFGRLGVQPTGRGSGPTDIEYLIDRMLAENWESSGYDWAGRIERGIRGTQPSEGGGGGYGQGTGGTQTGVPGVPVSSYAAQFDDPSTRHLEDWMTARLNELKQPVDDPSRAALARLLDQQTALYQQQRTRAEAEEGALRERRGRARTSADEYINFAKQRAQKLQGPAYTGAEGEVLRTQALDPIEADRQATRQRAMERISARGMDPTSGIAQQLLNDVDASYDRSRAGAQNTLAYRQIEEQRSREREAQDLIASIPGAEEAVLRGDVNFIQVLNNLINQPQQGAIMSAGQSAALGERVRADEQNRRQEALAIAGMLQELPTNALQQSMAAIGQAPTPESISNMALQLYGIGQANRNQGLSWYETLGSALPYLSGAFGGRPGGGAGGGSNNLGGFGW